MAEGTETTGRKRTVILYGVMVASIIAGAVLLLATRPEPVTITVNPPPPTATASPTSTAAPITVYITGAVAQPGIMITMQPGSRVQDAVSAAGGSSPEADLEAVNLAAVLRDGDQVHVPARGSTIALATPSGGTRVAINQATAAEIAELPGIGPALAERIIAYRQANGPFGSLDALDEVEGIGPDLLSQISELIAFD